MDEKKVEAHTNPHTPHAHIQIFAAPCNILALKSIAAYNASGAPPGTKKASCARFDKTKKGPSVKLMILHAIQKDQNVLPAIQMVGGYGGFQESFSLAIQRVSDDAVARS